MPWKGRNTRVQNTQWVDFVMKTMSAKYESAYGRKKTCQLNTSRAYHLCIELENLWIIFGLQEISDNGYQMQAGSHVA